MPALSYYTNVHNTSLVILHRKGYRVWTEQDGDRVCAEKNGWDFMADDPVQLLGLITIYETHQPAAYLEYWWKIDEPLVSEESIPNRPPDYTPVCKQR